MNTTTAIENMLKDVVEITIGTSPNKVPYVRARQIVKTGPSGTFIDLSHQVEHPSLGNCLAQIQRQVATAKEMETKIVQVRDNKN